ncbi:uncharacterized [Tachysurus ichikawai]
MFDTTKKKLSGNKNNPNGKQILIVALHFFAESVKWRYLAGFKSLCIVFRCKVRDIEFQSSEAPTVKTQTIRDPAPQIRLDIQVITSQYLDIKRKIIGYQITLPL